MAKFKISFKGLEALNRKLGKARFKRYFNQVFGRSRMEDLAEQASELIYKRVKRGVASSESGIEGKFLPLSPSYIDFRKGKVKFFTHKLGHVYPVRKKFTKPVTGAFGTPAKSNLTLTGQMLDAISYRVKKGKFTIFIKKSSRKDSKLTNEEVAELVSRTRPFITLTKREQRTIIREQQRYARDIAKRLIK